MPDMKLMLTCTVTSCSIAVCVCFLNAVIWGLLCLSRWKVFSSQHHILSANVYVCVCTAVAGEGLAQAAGQAGEPGPAQAQRRH